MDSIDKATISHIVYRVLEVNCNKPGIKFHLAFKTEEGGPVEAITNMDDEAVCSALREISISYRDKYSNPIIKQIHEEIRKERQEMKKKGELTETELYIANMIRELREERGWSKGELGEKIGYSPTGISLIEAGTTRPVVKTLCMLAEVFDISPKDFFP